MLVPGPPPGPMTSDLVGVQTSVLDHCSCAAELENSGPGGPSGHQHPPPTDPPSDRVLSPLLPLALPIYHPTCLALLFSA